MEKRNILASFLGKFLELPLWIKEVLYITLKEEVDKYSVSSDGCNPAEMYQYYKPTLTYVGKKELASRNNQHEEKVYQFMEAASQGFNLIEITLSNFWTLEETAKMNMICIEKEYVATPDSELAKTAGQYYAGKIRIGEYYKRLGKINVDQLEAALRMQKELEAEGKKKGMATVLIDMGIVSDEDTKNILYIKDESKKRFIFDTNIIGRGNVSEPTEAVPIEGGNSAAVEKLMKENNLLKNKIKSIISVIQGQ